jgi:diphthamide synthase (EF-2-diphthine--ammonia ligase)
MENILTGWRLLESHSERIETILYRIGFVVSEFHWGTKATHGIKDVPLEGFRIIES